MAEAKGQGASAWETSSATASRDNGGREWGSDSARHLMDDLSRRLESMEHRITEMGRTAGRKATQVRDDTTSYIREKPLTAIGIAALAGVVVGWLSRR